jgi:hypothetical protein
MRRKRWKGEGRAGVCGKYARSMFEVGSALLLTLEYSIYRNALSISRMLCSNIIFATLG